MKPAYLRRKATAWAMVVGCALALVRCGHEQVAGSSVTTGNPTEIQVSFTGDGGGPVALTGKVEIFGATQIPVPGFKPEPLARFDVVGKQEFVLTESHFEGIADSLWPLGSKEGDTLARFNLVVTGDNKGAIVRDLGYRIKAGEFVLEDGTWIQGTGRGAQVSIGISALSEYRAVINAENLENERFNYLFLKGTGYAAKSDSGRFVFPALPGGSHPISFISLPDKRISTGIEDSVEVYGVNKQLVTGRVDTVLATDINIRLPMPDSYKP